MRVVFFEGPDLFLCVFLALELGFSKKLTVCELSDEYEFSKNSNSICNDLYKANLLIYIFLALSYSYRMILSNPYIKFI